MIYLQKIKFYFCVMFIISFFIQGNQPIKNSNFKINKGGDIPKTNLVRTIRESDFSDYDDELTPEEELLSVIKSVNTENEKLAALKKLFKNEIQPSINYYQEKDKDTALHIAVRKKEIKIISFLIQNGAKYDISNKKGRTALDIAKNLKREDIVNLLMSPIIKEDKPIEIEADTNIDLLNKNYRQSRETNYNKRKGTSKISGQIYEIEMAMLFLIEGIKRKDNKELSYFDIAGNLEEAGDFDDVVMSYLYKNEKGSYETKILFVQLKHKDTPTNDKEKITLSRLLTDANKKEMFSLKDYFYSYRLVKKEFSKEKHKNHPIFGSKFKDSDFIIYTNAIPHRSFDENYSKNIKRVAVAKKNFFNFVDNNHYFQLRINGDPKTDEKIIEILKYSSDCKLLAKELSKSIFPIDKNKKPEITNQGIIKKYQVPIVDQIIERDRKKIIGKIKKEFLEDSNDLMPETKIFRKIFFEELEKSRNFQSQKDIEELGNVIIKLPNNLGDKIDVETEIQAEPNDKLPTDIVEEKEITEFLSKFKLFISQPNDNQLRDVINKKLEIYYGLPSTDVDNIASDVEYKIRNWWKEKRDYLTETNRFLQESARVSFWFNVKATINLFTGREQELKDLHQMIQRNVEKMAIVSQITSVSGLGGIGKTELVRRYIQKHSSDYDNNIIWINAENERTLLESFNRLIKEKIKIPTKDIDGKEKNINALLGELYNFFSNRKSLFVFDNAEVNEHLKKYLPIYTLPHDAQKPYVLITSRYQEWDEGIEVLNLKELKPEEAIALVKKGLKINDNSQDDEIKELVKKLQYFPLALQQAIAYISDQQITDDYTISDYLKEYDEKSKSLLDSDLFKGIDNDYARTTFTTWKITLEKIVKNQEYGELAKKIIDTIAYFAPENINRELLFDLADGDQGKVKSAVRLLAKFSMINVQNKQRIISIHRLVQDVIRIEIKMQGLEQQHLSKILNLVLKNSNFNYVDHEICAWEYACYYEDLVKEFKVVPGTAVDRLIEGGRYQEASIFGNKQLEKLRSVFPPNNRVILMLQNYLALSLNNQGQYDDALKMYNELLKLKPEPEGFIDEDILNVKNHVAWVLDNQGKGEQALEIYQEILNERMATLGPKAPETLTTEDNIALTLYNLGKYKKSLDIYEKIYETSKEILGPDNVKTLKTGNNMALVLEHTGDLKKALQIYQEVYGHRKTVLGDKHPLTLMTKNNIVSVEDKLGLSNEEQLLRYKDIYRDQLEVLGMEHPDTIMTKLNIGIALGAYGSYHEALDELEEVNRLYKKKLGEEHTMTLSSRHSIAVVYHRWNKLKEALRIYQEVAAAQDKVLGKIHPLTLLTKNNMLEIVVENKEYDEALKIYNEIYKYRSEQLGEDHYDTLTTKSDIGNVLYRQGKYDEALRIFEDVYQKRVKGIGEDHFDTLATKKMIEKTKKKIFNSSRNIAGITVNECSSSSKRKRRQVEKNCLISWDDIDSYNFQNNDQEKFKIDSDVFFNYFINLSEQKQNKLFGLINEAEIIGSHKKLVKKISHENVLKKHLTKLGRISGLTMQGMIAKNALVDFYKGDYKGVAINAGFIVGGQGFAKLSEITAAKGLRFTSMGKFFIGKSLTSIAPFLGRGTSAFIIYDLVSQIKEYRQGNNYSKIGIVGDSIYLGVDVVEIGIEVSEAVGIVSGISAISGPIGATIGAVIFIGTDIYVAEKKVEEIDKNIHLTEIEKLIEGLRAFVGLEPEKYISELIERRQINNQLVEQGFAYLRNQKKLRSYVFPTGKIIIDACRSNECNGREFECSNHRSSRSVKDCINKFQADLNSFVFLNEEIDDLKWDRAAPENPINGEIFCYTKGNEIQPIHINRTYLCNNAIGITDLSKNKSESLTLFNLGDGQDFIKGFIDSPNIFIVENGYKTFYGGNENDVFILRGNSTFGNLFGDLGFNALDLTDFMQNADEIEINLQLNSINKKLKVYEMNKILGRHNRADNVLISCLESNNPRIFDGQGGDNNRKDHIKIIDGNCTHDLEITIRPNSKIENFAVNGNFKYVLPSAEGDSQIHLDQKEIRSNHSFYFDYEINDLQNVTVHKDITTFIFGKKITFNLTIFHPINTMYKFKNGVDLTIEDTGKIFAHTKSNLTIPDLLKTFLPLSKRLKRVSLLLFSSKDNQLIIIGSGNFEVIHSNPTFINHLIGNGGNNVYVINKNHKNAMIPLINIYNFDDITEDAIDTIDLRNIINLFVPLKIIQSKTDLIIKQPNFNIILKNATGWFKKIHVVTGKFPMEISHENNEWLLKPLAIQFDSSHQIIVITKTDVSQGTKLIIPKIGKNYTFARNTSDLVVTNIFDESLKMMSLCTVLFKQYFVEEEMKGLVLEFVDVEIDFKEHQKEIENAKEIDYLLNEYRNRLKNYIQKEILY